jgi:hypothetical protein
VEQELRFQAGHGGDYMSVDICKLASEHWEQWMDNPKNIDFVNHFLDPRIDDIGRRELIHHLMMPFKMLDDLKEGSSEQSEWNFKDDPSISIFTYLGLWGSGFFIPCVICIIKLSIPILFLFAVLKNDAKAPWELTNAIGDKAEVRPRALVCVLAIICHKEWNNSDHKNCILFFAAK